MKRSSVNPGKPQLVPILVGFVIMLFAMALLTLLMGICINGEYINIIFAQYVSIPILLLSSLIGGYISIHCSTNKKITNALVAVLLFVLTNLCIGLLFFDGVGELFVIKGIVCMLGVLALNFVSIGRNKKRKR